MRIGICDDEVYQRQNLISMCRRYSRETSTSCEIVEFTSGQEVIDYQGEMLHLLLLDIEMAGVDGIEVMKFLEFSDIVWRIVFVSSHTEAVWVTFGIKTMDFGRKPIRFDDIKKWIDITLREFSDEIVIKFDNENTDTYLSVSNIVYLSANGNYVTVHAKDRHFIVSRNLKYWQSKLPENNFIRIHKSYIVNFDFIETVNDMVGIRYKKIRLPIGRICKKNLKDEYNHYILNKVKGRLC